MSMRVCVSMCVCACVCTSARFTQHGSPKVHTHCGRCRNPLPVERDDIPRVCATLSLSVIRQWPPGGFRLIWWQCMALPGTCVRSACLSLALRSLGVCPGAGLLGPAAAPFPDLGKPAVSHRGRTVRVPTGRAGGFAPRPRQCLFLSFNHCHPSGDVPASQRGASRDGCEQHLPADRRRHASLCAHRTLVCRLWGNVRSSPLPVCNQVVFHG